MFEITSESADKYNVDIINIANNERRMLPFIPKKPVSRGSIQSKKELTRKQKINLPTLYDTQFDTQTINGVDKDKQNLDLRNKTAFAKQVKERLNIVLGQMPYIGNCIEDDDQDSDDVDFQQRINQNRQLIKMHKIKKENVSKNVPHSNKQQNFSKNKRQNKIRKTSLNDKKIRQYRNASIQNKYLKQKKENVKQQQNFVSDQYINHEIKQKSKNQNIQNKNDKSSDKKPKSRGIVRLLSQRSSHKNLIIDKKNQNLFDNIQNYLSNPHGKQNQNDKQLVGLALLKAKRDIEDKIKAIDAKLDLQQNEQKSSEKQQLNISESMRDWRKIEIGKNIFRCQKSNFDQQIEKINKLQQKNSQCIEKYVQYQKILVQLEIRKKQLTKINVKSH